MVNEEAAYESVKKSELNPVKLILSNHPNPFNPVTQISYTLPEDSQVRLEVFDTVGRRVAVLVDRKVPAGTHRVTFDAADLSSGVYLYRLQTGSRVITEKMLLLQ